MTGVHQSPINIIDKINTKDDPHSSIQFLYQLEKEFAESYQKLKYDGRGLSLKAEIGKMIFTHADGTQEVFEANQIEFHYPSEHTITLNSQTPRYPLEIHIIHRFIKTSNRNTTNLNIQVKKAIISILFKGDSEIIEGDAFLSSLGIDDRLKRPDGTFRTVKKGEYIDSTENWLGNVKPGFDINALIALKDLLNFDHWIFRYYGSDTQPPCTEDAHRFVFAIPRSANKVQIDFLKAQLMKQKGCY
jgi:carbonic anhydrase